MAHTQLLQITMLYCLELASLWLKIDPAQAVNTKGGSITVPLTSCLDWFGLVYFGNKNKNCQLSYS
jgi:hypothetical protein